MASEPKVGDVRQDGSLRQQVWLGSGWYYVGSPIATKLVSAELSAAREMREVLGLCLPCIDKEIHDPRTLVDRRDSLAVLRRRVARLIGGGE